MTIVNIVQLYPDELGVAGDRGNVMAVTARLSRAGIEARVTEHAVGDVFPAEADLVIVGNGPLSAMRNVYEDLTRVAERLHEHVDSGAPLFAYGSGAELLGSRIELLDHTALDGLGVFPFSTRRIAEHRVGYILTDTVHGRVVGFEDNASLWDLEAGAAAFGTIVAGSGNGDGREGVLLGSSIATQVGGPVLPLNPALTDAVISSIASLRGFDYAPDASAVADLDRYAAEAREVMTEHANHVFSRI